MIKTIDAGAQERKTLAALIYGHPNSGKTTLALTASNPLLMDFDDGAFKALTAKGVPQVAITTWKDVEAIEVADLRPYGTIIVDTVGKALDLLEVWVQEKVPGAKAHGTTALKGYGAMKAGFGLLVTKCKQAQANIVFIGHMTEQEKNGIQVERLIATGSSRDLVYQSCPLIVTTHIENGRFWLNAEPSAGSYRKNPFGAIPNQEIPEAALDGAFQRIIDSCLEAVNREAQEGRDRKAAAEAKLADLREQLSVLTADELTAMAKGEMAKAPQAEKRILMDVATEAGLSWDKAAKKFVKDSAEPESDTEAAKPAEAPKADGETADLLA